MYRLDIRLFGPLDVTLDGHAVTEFRSKKVRALLAYLALAGNRPVARQQVATLLWGDYPDEQARKSLRTALTNLRQLFTPADAIDSPYLVVDRQTVQLNVDSQSCIVDVVRFDECLRNARVGASQSNNQALLDEAVTLWRDELMVDLTDVDSAEFEEWRLFQQESRHRQFMEALQQLAAAAIMAMDFSTAQSYAHRQLQFEPWNESAHRQLMRAMALQGDRTAALNQFATCRQLLRKELGVEPAAETMALFEQIREGQLTPSPQPAQPTITPPASLLLAPPAKSIAQRAQILNHLAPMPDQQLFGIAQAKAELYAAIEAPHRPWIIALDGIGGIGKTTLTTLLIHELLPKARFVDMAWVSAKQEEFRPATGITTTGLPALDEETLTNTLLEQLMAHPPLTATLAEKQRTLTALLKEQPYLIVVDNLETVTDYQVLIPLIRRLAAPSKFVITSRLTLQEYADIFCYSLTELSAAQVYAFIRYEATGRNIARLVNATDEQLESIYQTVGGNPLALKLVIGQTAFLPLPQVLTNLELAQGKKIDQLYTYIYWQAWAMLDDVGRQLLLAMPTVDDGTFAELTMASGLDPDETQEALLRLIALSLVQVSGDLDEPRYRLHRLTETFLMHEVLKWQSPS